MTQEQKLLLNKMVRFTVMQHEGEFRESTGLPYIVHPLGVMSMLAEWGVFCIDTWLGALGHDLRESKPQILPRQISRIANKKVAFIIEELTFIYDPKLTHDKKTQKELYIAQWMKREEGRWCRTIESLVIKIADRCCNTWDFLQSEPQKALKYLEKGQPLMDAVLNRQEEIAQTYSTMDIFPRIKYTWDELSNMSS